MIGRLLSLKKNQPAAALDASLTYCKLAIIHTDRNKQVTVVKPKKEKKSDPMSLGWQVIRQMLMKIKAFMGMDEILV